MTDRQHSRNQLISAVLRIWNSKFCQVRNQYKAHGSGSGLPGILLTDRENIYRSVADPNPDPKDPLVFGPPGSGPDPLARGMDQDPSIIK
jgi:hypothetical protein